MNRPVVKFTNNPTTLVGRMSPSHPGFNAKGKPIVNSVRTCLEMLVELPDLDYAPWRLTANHFFGGETNHITSNPTENSRGGFLEGFWNGFLSKLKVGIGDATSVQKKFDQVCRLKTSLVSLKVPKRRKLSGEIETHICSNGLKPPTNQLLVSKDYPRFAKCLCVCCFFAFLFMQNYQLDPKTHKLVGHVTSGNSVFFSWKMGCAQVLIEDWLFQSPRVEP